MRTLIAAATLFVSALASAEVVSAGEHGFELRHSVAVSADPQAAYAAFGDPARWWDSSHTYSGSASNMSMILSPGGCFCERLSGGGGVEHMRVAYVDPAKRIVLTGSLGPLLYLATAGVMDVQFKAGSGNTEVTVDYRVAGFANGGAAKLAPLVDKVLADQLQRYRAFANTPAQR